MSTHCIRLLRTGSRLYCLCGDCLEFRPTQERHILRWHYLELAHGIMKSTQTIRRFHYCF